MRLFKKLIIVAVIVMIALVTFFNQFNTLINDFTTTAKSREAQVNRHVDLSKGLIDLIALYGSDYFHRDTVTDSDLFPYLQYDAQTNYFHLDKIEGTSLQKVSGNLTGLGAMPDDPAMRDEINLALQMNHLFYSVYRNIPDAAWLYYTSENNFINIFPWIASKDFSYSEALKNEVFYTSVTPDRNPFRVSRWSPVYLDHAGKGLMVTVSSPVYHQDQFKGVVSLDLTNEQLSNMIQSSFETYIIDPAETVIASNWNPASDEAILKLDTVMQTTRDNVRRIRAISGKTISRIGGFFYYNASINNAPWKLISRVSVWLIIGRSALFTFPVFMVGILLLLTTMEVEKRKRTEYLLTNSLQELKSYHKLLENAAKYDFLTSTVNRRGLMDIFNKKILDQPDEILTVIMGDIDLFKQFNDRYGHAAGDKVLIEITRIIQLHLAPDDAICRWGGEEFVILLAGRSIGEALLLAEKIRLEIEADIIPWENTIGLRATMTFGVAGYDHDLKFEDNVAKADRALYFAKQSGRNQVIGYQEYQAHLASGSGIDQPGRHT